MKKERLYEWVRLEKPHLQTKQGGSEMKRGTKLLAGVLATGLVLAGCSSGAASAISEKKDSSAPVSQKASSVETEKKAGQEVTLLVAAAASLEYSFRDELIPLFEEKNPGIRVEGTYDSSGKLQTQIEEGLEADLFVSAATKQMKALEEGGWIDPETVVELLENQVVLIAPAQGETQVTGFEDIDKAQSIAAGDPASVPAGEYAQQVLTHLGVWDKVQPKLSLGTNVTEVLAAVAENSAEVGIVYATDAATTDKVRVIATAPKESLEKRIIYPAGVVKASAHPEEAGKFLEFLASPEAIAIFEKYGFKQA